MNDVLLVVVVAIALGFDFTNGFHDTANAIATSVGTRAVTPRMAVLIASVANLAGAFVTTAVAKNVAKGLIDANLATQQTLLAALFGAITPIVFCASFAPCVNAMNVPDASCPSRKPRLATPRVIFEKIR